MATPNLAIAHVTATQTSKEVTINAAFDKLDLAMCDPLSKSVAGSSDVTLTSTEALENAYFDFTGAITANINVIIPTNKKFYVCKNSTTGAFTLKVKTSAGTGIFVGQGNTAILYCDGTNVIQVCASLVAAGPRFQVVGYLGAGKPDAGATVFLAKMVDTVDFPTNLSGSSGTLGTATTASKSFSVRKNGTEFGTIDFAAAATEATFTGTATTLSPGDKLSIIAPASQDATLAGFGFILKGTVQ